MTVQTIKIGKREFILLSKPDFEKLAAQAQGDEAHQHGRRHIDERAQQQDQSDQPIGTREQYLCQARAAAAFIGSMPQTVAVHAHERRFTAGEKCGENQ